MATVTIKGMERLLRKLDKLGITTEKTAQIALTDSVKKIQGEARKMINTTEATGRLYGKHRASAAGQSPKTDTGNLVRNIVTEVKKGSAKVGVIGQQAIYGAYLELGTSKMGARPWLKPSTDKSKKFIEKSFSNALKKQIRKVARGG